MQAWLANDGNVEDEKGLFALVNVDGVVLTATMGCDFDFR